MDNQSMTQKKRVLGLRVDEVSRKKAMSVVENWIGEKRLKMKLIVTAYSEFFITAQKDKRFWEVMSNAELVVPDGAAVLAALRYQEQCGSNPTEWCKIKNGLKVGWEGIRGNNGETVTGVWLFEEIIRRAAVKGWRIYLLGGFADTAVALKNKLMQEYPDLLIEADNGGQRIDNRGGGDKPETIEKINKFKPDVLFVAYGPVKQEKWIDKHRETVKAKLAVGVGGTYDEVLGRVKRVPRWVEKRGWKSFWRLAQQPKRLRRMMRAWFVFPWMVYRDAAGN